MSIDKYRVLMKVLEMKSIQKAARALNQAPSTVSYAISSLEDELGVALLTRSSRGAFLTACGEEILPMIRKLLQDQRDIELAALRYRQFRSGVLRVGGSQTFLARYMPELLSGLLRDTGVQAQIQMLPYQNIEEDLYRGNLDVAFVPRTLAQDFKFVPLMENRFVFVMPPDHPLSERKGLSLRDVQGENILVPGWFCNHRELDFWGDLLQRELEPGRLLWTDDVSSTIALAQNHFGLGLLFESVLPRPAGCTAVPVEGVDSYSLGMLYLSTSLSPALKTFIRYAKEHVKAQRRRQS